MKTFDNIGDAEKARDALNSAPLPEGKERRVPSKVYTIEGHGKVKHVVAQSPQSAVGAVYDEFGITCTLVGDKALPSVSEIMTRFSPEALALLKAQLANV